MYLLRCAIIGLSIFIIAASCQAATFEYSNAVPWTFLYTYYNPESLPEEWGHENPTVSVSHVSVTSAEGDKGYFYSNEVQHNGTTGVTEDQFYTDDFKNTDNYEVTKDRQRLQNYRNWQSDSSVQK